MSHSPSLLRPARPEDADAIAKVNGDAWRANYRGIFPEEVLERRGREPDAGERRRRWIAKPDMTVLVAEGGGEVLGFVMAGPPREPVEGFDAEVYGLYVHPTRQGRGWGRRLLEAGAAALAERGHRSFFLWTLRDLPPTRAFYDARGGRVVAESTAVHEGVSVARVAYGWDSLEPLLREATLPGV
jgi:ribosomal protein S18 acetylase RimI-like enzyme